MPVEALTGTVTSLDPAYPLGSEGLNEGDNHLRALKQILKNTLPNAATPITATGTELSYSVGVTSGIQAQINARGLIAGQVWSGSHTFSQPLIVATALLSTQATTLGQVAALIGSSPAVAIVAGPRRAIRGDASGAAVTGFKAINQHTLRRTIRRARYAFTL
jgi:hypothetical protein